MDLVLDVDVVVGLACQPNSAHMEGKEAALVVLAHGEVSSLCASSPAL